MVLVEGRVEQLRGDLLKALAGRQLLRLLEARAELHTTRAQGLHLLDLLGELEDQLLIFLNLELELLEILLGPGQLRLRVVLELLELHQVRQRIGPQPLELEAVLRVVLPFSLLALAGIHDYVGSSAFLL
jgi:hypothetical protein